MKCLDLGCGGGHVSRCLARLVGEGGRVVGLDLDQVKLDAARDKCSRAGLSNLEFQTAGVTRWREPAAYDVVYGRFILSHLAARGAAYERYCELYRAVIRRRGGDADLGPQLYGLCHAAGLRDVEVQVVQPVHSGHQPEKSLALSALVNIADAVLAEELATSAEVDAALAGLKRYTEDPRSVVSVPRIFQVWGRTIS